MQVWLRLLIIWFIAVALPVQGMAAVVMLHCGPNHERMGGAIQASEHEHVDHDAGAGHHHGADLEGADPVDTADPDTHEQAKAQADELSDLTQTKCSSCASCCAGSALPSTTPHLPQTTAASAVFIEKMVTVDAFATDGPDRPPRTLLV